LVKIQRATKGASFFAAPRHEVQRSFVMIQLFDKETNALIGEIDEQQLAFLVSNLEEEDVDDVEYYLNEAMLDLLVEDGADAELVALFRKIIDETGEVEFRWQRT